MNVEQINLSGVYLRDMGTTGQSEEQLQEYELGTIVGTPDGPGIIAAYVEEPFEFPVGQSEGQVEEVEDDESPEMEEIDASSDEPYYIVALQDGGSVAVTGDEIDTDGTLEDDDGADIESWEDVSGEGGEADLSGLYDYCDGNPGDKEVLEDAKRKYIHENYPTELANYVNNHEATLATLEQMSSEELVNIRGVDDPHIGFDELPPGWTRKSVLQAWASLGGMWRTCFARMVRSMGPNFAKRWCAALKDEVLRTEEWRGKF